MVVRVRQNISSVSWGPTTIYEVDCPDAISWKRVEKLVPHRFGEHPAQALPHHRHLASLYARMYANLVYRDLRREYANFTETQAYVLASILVCIWSCVRFQSTLVADWRRGLEVCHLDAEVLYAGGEVRSRHR